MDRILSWISRIFLIPFRSVDRVTSGLVCSVVLDVSTPEFVRERRKGAEVDKERVEKEFHKLSPRHQNKVGRTKPQHCNFTDYSTLKNLFDTYAF
jgi:aminopeptidase-like protein